MDHTTFLRKAIPLLKNCFSEVEKEWDVVKESRDMYTREFYCPRMDIAIGPFNTTVDVDKNLTRIEEAFSRNQQFIGNLNNGSEKKADDWMNDNPRCFVAIEVENTGTRKHRLGSMVNASAIGKVGIIVSVSDKALKSLLRINKYVEYLKTVKKSSIPSNFLDNVMVITAQNFFDELEDASASQ